MSNAATDSNEPLRKFTRELPVELNDSELQAYGRMLADKCKEQELLIDKKKQAIAEHMARIKTVTNEIKRLAEARSKGEELRPVMCGERLHGNVIEIIRLDRGVIVDSRPAELQDLQVSIPNMDAPEVDEGPRGDEIGSGAAVEHSVNEDAEEPPDNVVKGDFGTSSSGDTVYNGAPNDVDEDTIVCGMCDVVVSGDDKTTTYEGSTIHADCLPALVEATDGATDLLDQPPSEEEDEVDRKLREREQWKQDEADADLAKRKEVEKRDAANIERLKTEQATADTKPKRERSKAKNDAKKSKPTSPAKKR